MLKKYLQMKALDLHQCGLELFNLRAALLQNRDNAVDDAMAYSKGTCSELGINMMEHRIRKNKRMDGEGSSDAPLWYKA